MRKAQTATEYLIILAVVIIISLIVVGVLGGIPGIGGGTASNANSAYWATADIGIIGMKASIGGPSSLILRNNMRDPIKIEHIFFDNQIIKSGYLNNFTIQPGKTYTYTNASLLGSFAETESWAFKTCLDGNDGVGVTVFIAPVPSGNIYAPNTEYSFSDSAQIGDSFEESITIQYVNVKTGARYNFTGEEKLAGECVT